jgi:RNA polymerase sigma-70 factor (ECF subfamily)
MEPNNPTRERDDEMLDRVQGLFVQYLPVVRATILARIPNPQWADDIVQETFLTVRKKAGDYRPGSNYAAWVCTIAGFKVKEALRGKVRRRFEPLSEEAMEALTAAEPCRSDPAERLRLFEQCMEKLAPKSRQVMELRYWGEHLPEEIALRMGWSLGAVRVAISKARALLQECVDKKQEANS